ncbi:ATP-binding cassette domain-containing protein [Frankia sp. AiPs1]
MAKRYGSQHAVRDVTFTVREGTVTGFLGPNGSGKTTTLRALLGLVTPSFGRAEVFDRPYRELAEPARLVGAALGSASHPRRSTRDHLKALATALCSSTRARCCDTGHPACILTDRASLARPTAWWR